MQPLASRIAFTWYNDLSFEEILKRAAALPPHSAIFWELMLVDAAGVVHEGGTALARLHAVANAPIFSYDDPSSAKRSLVVRFTPALEAAERRPPSPFASLAARRRAKSKYRPSVRNAEVRLEANAALGHQREPSAAGKQDSLSQSDRVGTIPLANFA